MTTTYRYPGEELPPAPKGRRWAPKTRPHLAEWQAYDEDDRAVPRGPCVLAAGQPFGARHEHRSIAHCFGDMKPAAFILVSA